MSSPQVFIYEFVTGGGLFHWETGPVNCSLTTEGRAMLESIAVDFAALPELRMVVMRDSRIPLDLPPEITVHAIEDAKQESEQYASLVHHSDYVLIIAPELDGWLARKTASVPAAKLLSPHRNFVEISSNKRSCHERLQEHGVPVPEVLSPGHLSPSSEKTYLVKPIDGAGSEGIRRLTNVQEAGHLIEDQTVIVQEECKGRAASIAVIGDGRSYTWLPACWQHVQQDFRYLGGSLITDPIRQNRALVLARRTLAALPQTRGYVGIDLILGPDINGSEDRVIEVNPRLTTSYIGLRAATTSNLAMAMLPTHLAAATRFAFRADPVEFLATGKVTIGSAKEHERRQGAIGP